MGVLDKFSLSGRKALVTGGNRGLGQAFATALAEAGADVAIAGRDAERTALAVEQAAGHGLQLHPITADITDDADVRWMTGEALDVLGGLDILVNNAGTCFHNDSWHTTDEEWAQVFDLNVRALWKCSLEAARHMKESGGGSIVNIGSMSGLIVNRPQWQHAYNASKAAVHHLTKSLAAEWAAAGIRVNAVAPGYVKTDMAPVDRPELRRHWIEDAPQQRYALPEEIAPAVVFLASDAASFITGSVVVADGGYTVY
ncbi:SDR family NAD(P)-dependent oxidoreductase [Streptomyces sp. NPDC001663]|uniref:SDR family NAD(P)-dependent oxidoreductase n=1 Tax=Streptomyces sp. NPDC001663 TaxID=3364597 RepID=UPI00369A5AF5